MYTKVWFLKIRKLSIQLVMTCVVLLYMGCMHVRMSLHCHVKPYVVKYVLIIDFYLYLSVLKEPNIVPKCTLC
jgi:hypothetical protein